jgi:hypothetical protein
MCIFRLITFFEKKPYTWSLKSRRPDVKSGFTGTPTASIIHSGILIQADILGSATLLVGWVIIGKQ